MAEVLWVFLDWLRVELIGEPQRSILNLPFIDDDQYNFNKKIYAWVF